MNIPVISIAPDGRVYDVTEGLTKCDYCALNTLRVIVIPERGHPLHMKHGGGMVAVCLRCRDVAGVSAAGRFVRDEGQRVDR